MIETTSDVAWRLTNAGPNVRVPSHFGRRPWDRCGAQELFPAPDPRDVDLFATCGRPTGHSGRHASYGVWLVVAVWP